MAVAGLVVLVACSSDDSDSVDTTAAIETTDPSTTVAATTTTDPPEAGMDVTGLVAEIPASLRPEDGDLVLIAGDLDLASELAEVERPPADRPEDLDALTEWMFPLQGLFQEQDPVTAVILPDAVVPRNLARNEEIAAEFGWSVLDVRSFVELQNAPESFAVLDVGLGADRLTDVLGDPVDGIWRLGSDEDGKLDRNSITAGRPLGDTLRFGLHEDGLLGVSKITPPVREWLDGAAETLADDAAIASVSAVLDRIGVYTVMIVDDAAHIVEGEADPIVALPEFDLLAAALSVVDGEAVGTFVYHYPSAEEASAAVDVARDIWTDGISVLTAAPISEVVTLDDVVAEDQNLVVTFRFPPGTSPDRIWRMVLAREITAVHG